MKSKILVVPQSGFVIQIDTTQFSWQTLQDTIRRSKEEAVCSTFMYAYGVDLISSWLTGSTLGWNFFWVSMFFFLGFLKSSIDVCSFPHVHFQYAFLGQNWMRKLGWSKLKWSIGDFFSWCIFFDYLFASEVIYSSFLYFLSIIMTYSLSNWLTKCKSFLFSCTWF